MGSDDLDRAEIEALLATRRELGAEYDRELVEAFADRIERELVQRSDEQAGRSSGAAGPRQTALGIVSVVMGIPLTAIAAGTSGLSGLLVAWAGIAGVNVAHAWQAREPQPYKRPR